MTMKEYSQQIASAVDAALAAGLERAEVIRRVSAQTGCHPRSVIRRLDGPPRPSANWGGRRPGAGYPKGRARSAEDRQNRRKKGLTSVSA